MTVVRRAMQGTFMCLGVASLASDSALSCTCVDSGDLQASIRKYQTIFLGQVVAQRPAGAGAAESVFRVLRVWKGKGRPELTVRTASSAEACGYRFVKGFHYVVVAYPEGSVLGSNRCTPTGLAAEGKALVQTLDGAFRVMTVVPEDAAEP